MLNQIIHGDCLEVMKDIHDKSIDMILCDLPYGITAQKWDSVIDFDKLWNFYKRVIKTSGTICLFSCQPFTTKLISSNEKMFKYCWYWNKNRATNFFHASKMPTRKVEEICVFYNKNKYFPQMLENQPPTNSGIGSNTGNVYHGKSKVNYLGGSTTRFPNNILEFKTVNNYSLLHPNEKPVALLEYLIKTYTNEGDVVLDNCIGSGSTAVAAINTNRNFIGIEKEENYIKIARERIEKVLLERNNNNAM